jgi:hypothetical protein
MCTLGTNTTTTTTRRDILPPRGFTICGMAGHFAAMGDDGLDVLESISLLAHR